MFLSLLATSCSATTGGAGSRGGGRRRRRATMGCGREKIRGRSTTRILFLVFLLPLLLLYIQVNNVNAEDNNNNNNNSEHCTADDTSAVSSSVPLANLQPNAFHKICPSESKYQFLGRPGCGDGSAFAFYVARPPQRKANAQKIMIEFAGGGACWDGNTCDYQQSYLTFPEQWNDFVGLSCSEIEAGMQQQDRGVSMLCAKQLGSVDLTAYTTIVVPYCTQDVHSGDNIITYNDDNDNGDGDNNNNGNGNGNGNTVVHRGAHNMMSVLRYVYKNFKNPQHIILTGCSAGGTALPLAYHLLHKHYNSFLRQQSTQVSVIADSPVFLTPSYFLENAIDNWNPWTLLQRIGFRYKKYKYDTAYTTHLWDYILRQGSNRDKWGFVTHTSDPVSLAYYEAMSGNGDFNNRNRKRQLDDSSAEWYTELFGALDTILSKHKNVDTFIMDNEEGHCTFGLYHGLQEYGFDEWAAAIVQEQRMGGAIVAAGHFILAFVLGALLVYGIGLASHQRQRTCTNMDDSGLFREFKDDDDDADDDSDNGFSTSPCISPPPPPKKTWKDRLHFFKKATLRAKVQATVLGTACLQRFASYPLTAGYAVTVTVYFCIMLFQHGFTHPLNNPALGPNAMVLSDYGINNPSLIVYKTQVFRLFTSAFLCSGVLTYLLTMLSLWFVVRPLEMQTTKSSSHREFVVVCLLILLGCNLIYAMLGNGASCSSWALVLGLHAFVATISTRTGRGSKCCLIATTVFLTVLASVVFTFNSWIMILAALALGGFVVPTLILDVATPEEEDEDAVLKPENGVVGGSGELLLATRRPRLNAILGVYGILFVFLLFRIRRPDRLYAESPYYTGCDPKYSDALEDISSSYFGGGGDDRLLLRQRRWLEEENEDGLCAQFCIPHLLSRGATLGARAIFSFEIQDGFCPSSYEHYVDKTYRYFTYSLDVEIFQNANNNDERA